MVLLGLSKCVWAQCALPKRLGIVSLQRLSWKQASQYAELQRGQARTFHGHYQP